MYAKQSQFFSYAYLSCERGQFSAGQIVEEDDVVGKELLYGGDGVHVYVQIRLVGGRREDEVVDVARLHLVVLGDGYGEADRLQTGAGDVERETDVAIGAGRRRRAVSQRDPRAADHYTDIAAGIVDSGVAEQRCLR